MIFEKDEHRTSNIERRTSNEKLKYDDLTDREYEDFCTGTDKDGCYGLVMEVCRRMGIELPDYRCLAMEISNQEKIEKYRSRFQEVEHPEPGDLVLIRSVEGNEYHIAVVVERSWFLHATRENNVHKVRLNHPLYKSRIEGIYRHVGL